MKSQNRRFRTYDQKTKTKKEIMLRAIFVASSVARAVVTADDTVSFVTLGDWGGAALGNQAKAYKDNQFAVADALAKVAADNSAQFLINTGDSFYWCGITSVEDYQVFTDFADPYNETSLNIPWYSVLGK